MELIQKQVHYTQEGKRTFDQFYLEFGCKCSGRKGGYPTDCTGAGNRKSRRYTACRKLCQSVGKITFSNLIYYG